MAKNENKTLSSVEVQNMLKDIRKKIKKGVSTLDLKHYLSDTYGYTEHTAECYISKARKELKEYYLKDKEHFAEEFYLKYNYLYQQSIENNNIRAAKDILDSMVKLTGAGEFNKQKVEFDGDSPIVISFGFDKNERRMNIKFDIKLTSSLKKAYDLIHLSDTRYLVARWSRQQGKTIFSEIMLIEYLFKKNTFNGYISPTFAQGLKVYREIIQLLDHTGIIKTANASTLTITTIFGSTLQFFSVLSYTAIRGNTIRGLLVMDELGFFPDLLPDGLDIWGNVIYAIVKANIKRNKIVCISTPNGRRGCFYKFYNNCLNKVPGWKELVCTIYDDDLVTEEQIEEIKLNVSELAFRLEFLVEWLDNGLTFFQGFEDCFTTFTYDDSVQLFIGIDLSGTGSDETVLTKINLKNLVKQYVIKGTLDSKYKLISDIINSTKNLKNVYIENNGLAVPMINEIRKLVNNKNLIKEFTTTNESKNEVLSALAIDIARKEIYFDVNDKQLYSLFSTFTAKYSKTGRVLLIAMDGFHDDRILSLGFAHYAKSVGLVLGNYNFSFSKK